MCNLLSSPAIDGTACCSVYFTATCSFFTVTCSSNIKGRTGIFVHTVVHESTVRSVACNKLECQKEVVVTY